MTTIEKDKIWRGHNLTNNYREYLLFEQSIRN